MMNFLPALNHQPAMSDPMDCRSLSNYSTDQQLAMNNYTPAMNYQPVQPGMNYQPVQPAMNYQPVQPGMNYQPVQPAMNYQSVQPGMNYQLVQPGMNYQPVQPMMNYSVDNQQQSSFNGSCVISVSNNFLLKFPLRGDELKSLRNGQRLSLRSHTVNPLYLEIDPDSHITFKPSDKWESFDIVYAFVESKGRPFSLVKSPQLSFLTPFQPSSVCDEAAIHCSVIAYPRCCTVDTCQYIGPIELPTVPETMAIVSPNPRDLPRNYKNENVINFIRKGAVPNFDVDMAIEIIAEENAHKCKVLTILCKEYLRKNTKNTTVYDLKKISKAARVNSLLKLQEKCLIEFEKCEITKEESKVEKTKKEHKPEKSEVAKKENKPKKKENSEK